ncbi:phosphonoacetaldehyde reductase [Vibrio campbellii]|uniref:phosphonoacetaldehyde reductase n=1 Tax=Vibrio campbellii TaxID=680 RepID=UPI0038CD6F57
MWQFHNPVSISFGKDALPVLETALNGRKYAIVTYDHPYFDALADEVLSSIGGGQAIFNQVSENPDIADLPIICDAFSPHQADVEVLVAIGGGSVIDTTKALAAARSNARVIHRVLTEGEPVTDPLPMIVLPTTTGTGSEVTCWATIWDKASNKKFSLSDPSLYPEMAICDPKLTLELPISLTVQTGLDALSHAMESIWNHNVSPVSLMFAQQAITTIRSTLPALIDAPQNLQLRNLMMQGSLNAGLAFSNTKTSISHNLSYAVTLRKGLPHGIACSFTLPAVLASFAHSDCETSVHLRTIFGTDLQVAAQELEAWIHALNVKTQPEDYGFTRSEWKQVVEDALQGERGKNFSGCSNQLMNIFF